MKFYETAVDENAETVARSVQACYTESGNVRVKTLGAFSGNVRFNGASGESLNRLQINDVNLRIKPLGAAPNPARAFALDPSENRVLRGLY